jgi:regulator of cell morphogenesis and NO signaling
MNDSWNDKPLRELMEHIVAKHHAFCREEMTRIGRLFKESVSRDCARPELKRMELLFAAMARDLAMHLIKEEQTLFPYIARIEEAVAHNAPVSWPSFGNVGNPIRMMVLEHEQTGTELAEIRRLSNGYTAPPDAPEPLTALYDGLRAFDLNMADHIHAEDHLLFPLAIAMEERACAQRKPA